MHELIVPVAVCFLAQNMVFVTATARRHGHSHVYVSFTCFQSHLLLQGLSLRCGCLKSWQTRPYSLCLKGALRLWLTCYVPDWTETKVAHSDVMLGRHWACQVTDSGAPGVGAEGLGADLGGPMADPPTPRADLGHQVTDLVS